MSDHKDRSAESTKANKPFDRLKVIKDWQSGKVITDSQPLLLGSDSVLAAAIGTIKADGLSDKLRYEITDELRDVVRCLRSQAAIEAWLKSVDATTRVRFANLDQVLDEVFQGLDAGVLIDAKSHASRILELLSIGLDFLARNGCSSISRLEDKNTGTASPNDQIQGSTELMERISQLVNNKPDQWAVFDFVYPNWPNETNDSNVVGHSCIPVLLVNTSIDPNTAKDADQGIIGWLECAKLNGGNGCFYAELGTMGLTVCSNDADDGFAPSMERIFKNSGVGVDNTRFRWSIMRHPNEQPKTLEMQRFRGRSVEAAFMCALWKANGGIPGEHDDERFQIEPEDTLDARTAVTACLGEFPESGKRSEIPLDRISGLVEKAIAAQRSGIDLIVVAKNCSNPEQQDDWNEKIELAREAVGDAVEILPVETIGDAFYQLTFLSRTTRIYHAACRVDWDEKFYPVDDEGNRIEPENGKDVAVASAPEPAAD